MTNIDQLYNICFMDANSKDYGRLTDMGVEVEQYESDTFMDQVVNGEVIWEDNLIESLK